MNGSVSKWTKTNISGQYEKSTKGNIGNGNHILYKEIVTVNELKTTVATSNKTTNMRLDNETGEEVDGFLMTGIEECRVAEIDESNGTTVDRKGKETSCDKTVVNESQMTGFDECQVADSRGTESDELSDKEVNRNSEAPHSDKHDDTHGDISDDIDDSNENDDEQNSNGLTKSFLDGLNICQYKLR